MKINCRDCGGNPHEFSDFEIKTYKKMYGKKPPFICKQCYIKLKQRSEAMIL